VGRKESIEASLQESKCQFFLPASRSSSLAGYPLVEQSVSRAAGLEHAPVIDEDRPFGRTGQSEASIISRRPIQAVGTNDKGVVALQAELDCGFRGIVGEH
jgi:hypothetical protein